MFHNGDTTTLMAIYCVLFLWRYRLMGYDIAVLGKNHGFGVLEIFFAVLTLSTCNIARSGMQMIQHWFGKISNEVPQRSSGGAALDLWEEGRFTKDFKLAPTVSTHHFLIKCHWQTLIYSWHDQDMWDSTPLLNMPLVKWQLYQQTKVKKPSW